MNNVDTQYLNLCEDILNNGKEVTNRTGTSTLRVFSRSMRFDLSEGFPLLTTKKIRWENIIGEVLWFLNGETDLHSLRLRQNKPPNSHTIWSDDFEKYWERLKESKPKYSQFKKEREDGGFIYGRQLRGYGGDEVDQLKILVENIVKTKENPNFAMARRLKCEFWNPEDHLDEDSLLAALPACHTGFQCMVDGDKLNLKFAMRSNDVFLGLPYNIASYAAICHILAKLTGLKVGELVYDGCDVHIYKNHIEQIKEQLTREPLDLPEIVIVPDIKSLEDLKYMTAQDFEVVGYRSHSFLKGKQAS